MIIIDQILDVEQYLDGVDGVIFDLDDTLYSEKDYVRSGYRAIAEQFPQIDNMEEKLWNVFERGGKAIDEVFTNENLLAHKAEALDIYRSQKPDIRLYTGIEALLIRLKDQKKKLGIITDGRPKGQNAKLDALGLKNVISEIIITDELGGVEFRKPNPKAFEIMQMKFDISFNKICYVGDNPQKDFIAPERLGMKWIYFRNSRGLYSK